MQESGLNKFRAIVSEVSFFVVNPVKSWLILINHLENLETDWWPIKKIQTTMVSLSLHCAEIPVKKIVLKNFSNQNHIFTFFYEINNSAKSKFHDSTFSF